jgi:adenylyltransferase/sulfurtransferase
MSTTFFSRERAAGYDPDALKNAIVLLVGAGALGQNILMDLALSQVGMIYLVDFDEFESHNATRSPFFPNPAESHRWGRAKVAVTAHKARQMTSWSTVPEIYYANRAIQALGDAPFRESNVVVSAVDKRLARNYLGLKAKQHRIPLIEGGFSGSHVNATVLLNQADDDPCWFCNLYETNDRNRAIQLSCTRAAKLAKESGFIPAIQPAASFLGAFMTEVTIQLLHGNGDLSNSQVVMDVRSGRSSVACLQKNQACPHCDPQRNIELRIGVPADATCEQLLSALERHVPRPVISLPFDYVVRVSCAQCKQSIVVNQPDWVMQELLFCRDCCGKWERVIQPGIEIYPTLCHDDELLLPLPISDLGIVPGSLIEIESHGRELLCELECGTDLPFFTKVRNGGF